MSVDTLPKVQPGRRESTHTRQSSDTRLSPLYNVVLLDDDAHTYQYVVEMLTSLIGCPSSWAFEMACEVDAEGRVIVDTTTREEAQVLQAKIHSYGADWRISHSAGSMTAVVEPVE